MNENEARPDPPNTSGMRCIASILFGLLTLWTGLLRSVEAHAYKPKALWFCFVMGFIAITAGFLYRTGHARAGIGAGLASALLVFGYYITTFINAPEEDATLRVATIIIGAIAYLIALLLPDRAVISRARR